MVVTKDADFVNSFHLRQAPHKLLLISTGNIRNTDLAQLMLANLDLLVSNLEQFDFVELNRTAVIVHT